MRIAVPSANDRGLDAPVSDHFGRCPYFTVADVVDGEVQSWKTVANPHYPDHLPGAVPRFLSEQQVDVVLTRELGQRALQFLQQRAISAAIGAEGAVRDALAAFLAGRLSEVEVGPRGGHGGCHQGAPCRGAGRGACRETGEAEQSQ